MPKNAQHKHAIAQGYALQNPNILIVVNIVKLVKAVLVTPAMVGRIESLLPDSNDAALLLNELSTMHSSLTSACCFQCSHCPLNLYQVQGLLDFISNSMPADIQNCTPLGRAYSKLKQKQHEAKAQARLLAGVADHREKRNMASQILPNMYFSLQGALLPDSQFRDHGCSENFAGYHCYTDKIGCWYPGKPQNCVAQACTPE